MSNEPKKTDITETEVIRKLVIPIPETDANDGSRSVTKDRDLGDSIISQTNDTTTDDKPLVIRKPIVIEDHPEA